MNTKALSIIGGLAMVLWSCHSGFDSNQETKSTDGASTAQNVDNLDAGVTNQAPKISCQITNLNNTSQKRSINTIGELDTFFLGYPQEGDTVSFDCSNTQDEGNSVSFFIDSDYDAENPDFKPFDFNLTLAAGNKTMALKAVDGDGLATVKTFAINAQCANGAKPVINASMVSITAESKHNFYTFSVPNGAVSGGKDFQFAWDFNGDGVFDPFDLNSSAGAIWNDSPVSQGIYSVFASAGSHRRVALLRVRNGCNMESDTVQVEMANELPNIARTPESQAVKKGYYYLQSDIRSDSIASSAAPTLKQRVNGPFLGTWYPGDKEKRVICSYNFEKLTSKASFTIQGLNWYTGGLQMDTGNQFIHGMEIRVNNIPDNGSSASQTYTQSDGVQLHSASYRVSAGDDGITHENFNRIDQACTIEITVQRDEGVMPCSSNSDKVEFTPTTATIILGEFQCPTLTNSSTGKSVSAQNGKFYCEVAPVDQCVGAGGPCVNGICSGGGGIPAIPQ
ncbi:MAG: hypothetical protein KDD43_03050 [Bdellovibrionales bacterium]|nr:hypothetical protein [Bdellovibrionales bacterium]